MTDLTDRQRDVAKLVAEGMTDAQIAAILQCGETTVRVHVMHIRVTLDLRQDRNARVQIARWWWEHAA